MRRLSTLAVDTVWIGIVVIGYLVALMPIVVILFASFSDANVFRFPPETYSLRWYDAAFSSTEYRRAVSASLLVGAISTAIALVAGAFAAYGLDRSRFRGKVYVEAILLAPLALPHIVWAIGLLQIYAWLGIGGSLLGLVLAHTTICMPFTVRIMMATFSQLDRSLEEAARSLGAPPLGVFRRVTLPLIWPGLVTSAVFTFLTSLNEVTVSAFIAGARYLTFPVRVYTELRSQGIDPASIAISALMIVVIVVLALAGERFLKISNRI